MELEFYVILITLFSISSAFGALTNGLCVLFIIKKLKVKRSLKQLVLLDSVYSSLCHFISLFNDLTLLLSEKNYIKCAILWYTTYSPGFLGILISVMITFIRYTFATLILKFLPLTELFRLDYLL